MCLTRLWYDKNMEANEYTEFEGRRYVNPTISRDEQMAFIDNLRNTQTANNEQIQTDTYNLGTHIPMTQGGLATGATDPDSYFMQRYQTPQVDSQVATLKATAQAQALNDVLSNYQKQVKQRYSDAYKAAQKRKGVTPTGPADPDNPEKNKLPIDTKTTGEGEGYANDDTSLPSWLKTNAAGQMVLNTPVSGAGTGGSDWIVRPLTDAEQVRFNDLGTWPNGQAALNNTTYSDGNGMYVRYGNSTYKVLETPTRSYAD